MSGKTERLRIDDAFYKLMTDRLEDEGWSSV